MPIINIKFIEQVVATPEQKQELVRRMTDTFVDVLGDVVRPFTYVVIEETKMYDWGIAGKPMPDLAWLCGDEYNGHIKKAQDIMGAYVAAQQQAASGDGGGGGDD
jgi:4-oxalocrotonate tautomerase